MRWIAGRVDLAVGKTLLRLPGLQREAYSLPVTVA
jgi:hypothetical protein